MTKTYRVMLPQQTTTVEASCEAEARSFALNHFDCTLEPDDLIAWEDNSTANAPVTACASEEQNENTMAETSDPVTAKAEAYIALSDWLNALPPSAGDMAVVPMPRLSIKRLAFWRNIARGYEPEEAIRKAEQFVANLFVIKDNPETNDSKQT